MIEGGDRQRQRLDRAPRRLQPRARVVEHRGRAGELRQRHHAHVERALRLARGLEQLRLLGQHGQARVAEQRARVLLQRRRQLARAPERSQEARPLAAHARTLAGRRLLERALEHRHRADHVAHRFELRRQPPPEPRPPRGFVFVGVRGAQQREPLPRRLFAFRDARHQLLRERERGVGPRVPRQRLLQQRQHLRRIVLAPRQQPLRRQVVIGGRHRLGLGRDRRQRHLPGVQPPARRQLGQADVVRLLREHLQRRHALRLVVDGLQDRALQAERFPHEPTLAQAPRRAS